MIKILFLILAKGKVTTNYIAHRFDISVRTVLRYLTAISLAGIPIISEVGRNGGYYIPETYKINSSFLTESEFNRIIGILSSYNDKLNNSELSSAIEKLQSINKHTKTGLDVKSDYLIIDGSAWIGDDNTGNVISLVEKSIENGFTIKIKYIDKQGIESTREIEPHFIILKQGTWYIYAYCRLRENFRMFKAARIVYADRTTTQFQRRNCDFTTEKLVDWFGELPTEFVDLQVDISVKADIEEWLGVNAVRKENDKFYASANLPYDNWLISRILGFGSKVKILSPEKLKKDVISAADDIINMYKK